MLEMDANIKINESHKTATYLGFCLGAQEYVIALDATVAICALNKVMMFPRSQYGLSGLLYFVRTVTPVIDIRTRTSRKTRKISKSAKVIVLEKRLDNKVKRVGVIVETISQLYDRYDFFSNNSFYTPDQDPVVTQFSKGWLIPQGHESSKQLPVLSLERLLIS